MTLRTTSSANEVHKILKGEAAINIVISEYHLPNLNSLRFLKKVKAIDPYLEIIFFSSRANLDKAIEGKQGLTIFMSSRSISGFYWPS